MQKKKTETYEEECAKYPMMFLPDTEIFFLKANCKVVNRKKEALFS